MPLRTGKRDAGLTLLEVMAATAVVLVTVTAVTTVTVTAARAGGRAQAGAATDAVLLAEAARLRALPFFVPVPPDWPATRQASVPSVVGELFPHTDSAFNDQAGVYHATGALAGAFETSVSVDGVAVRRTAWMITCLASGWRRVPLNVLDGWRAWGGVGLPAEAVLVRLEASPEAGSPAGGDGRWRSLMFVLPGGGPRSVDPAALADESSGSTP